MANQLYNLKIPVKNLNESASFYQRVFEFLGFNRGRLYDDPIDKKKTLVMGNGFLYIELVEEPGLVPKTDLTSICGPRMEFLASNKEEVDLFFDHLVKNNVQILLKPQFLFQELLGSDDYWYAVYFADCNGMKFGLVFTPKDIR